MFKIISQAIGNLENNAFCGIQVPKKLIPQRYSAKGIKNLWKYDLPKGWRMIYSIVNENLVVISIILEWLDHKNYERLLHY